MNPRTATAQESIWRPSEEIQFHKTIRALWKRTKGRPKDPQTYPIPTSEIPDGDIFPLVVELEVANGVAFIAATKKGVKQVSATAIERPRWPSDGLRLNLAANEEIQQIVRDKMDRVVAILRKAAKGAEITLSQSNDDILNLIIQLNHTRIDTRLKNNRSRYVVWTGLSGILHSLTKRPDSDQQAVLLDRLRKLCRSLKDYCERAQRLRTAEDIKTLVVACYDFFDKTSTGGTMKNMLQQVGINVDESRGDPSLRQIGKIASYCHIARRLSTIAAHREFRSFFTNISIRYLPAYPTTKLPIPAADGGSRDCRVHAEVQLVANLDVTRPSKWMGPRGIGSSKAACFLCELFINKHGGYFVPRTHGKLTPRWTIPDLDQFSRSQLSQYRNIIGAMNHELQSLVDLPHPRRLDPAMSWQAFSQFDLVPIWPMGVDNITSRLSVENTASRASGFLECKNAKLVAVKSTKSDSGAIGSEVHLRHDTTVLPISAVSVRGPSPTSICLEKSSDRSLLRDTWGPQTASSSSERIHKLQHLPNWETQRQVRPLTNLDYEQHPRAARVIEDHESRTCDMPFECDMMDDRLLSQSNKPHSDGMCRRIDFHDMELFLEIEYPATAQVGIIQCLKPDASESPKVIEVEKIEPGAKLEIDIGEDLASPRSIFLLKRDNKGMDKWWECRWQNCREGKKQATR
ncbi:hypothetical protein PV05_06960 [Exophiala xenobiotica]|uniref:Uncharacterized protein n=1 Tax=Exophiala xenobiotica TaxID=348802 RepID=A0A0D2BPZ5_9EURO|nr:uncharacterized protein PV05_06960 [Exophiala xenobiotica]KIW54611.1 hypothetical protein PV05_06960 [Exophiala xenobiotica]